MAIVLEGGCRVSHMHEGDQVQRGTLRVWRQVTRALGAKAISLRILEFSPGLSPAIRNENCDEIIYVLESANNEETNDPIVSIFIDGHASEVSARTGIYLRPKQTLTISNPGPQALTLVSSQ